MARRPTLETPTDPIPGIEPQLERRDALALEPHSRPRHIPAHLIRMVSDTTESANGPGIQSDPDESGVIYVEHDRIDTAAGLGFRVEH